MSDSSEEKTQKPLPRWKIWLGFETHGFHYLCWGMACFSIVLLHIWIESGVRRNTNFYSHSWTLERLFEIYIPEIFLPIAGGFAALAAMRGPFWIRLVCLGFLSYILVAGSYYGITMYQQW